MDGFDVSDMCNALQEADVNKSKPNPLAHLDPEAATLARSKGWAIPENYDYAKYIIAGEASQPLDVDAAADAAAARVEGMAEGMDDEEFPEWAAKAAKYEWKDEYGEVGPQNEELERMLFRSEFISRTGLKINKYLPTFFPFCYDILTCQKPSEH